MTNNKKKFKLSLSEGHKSGISDMENFSQMHIVCSRNNLIKSLSRSLFPYSLPSTSADDLCLFVKLFYYFNRTHFPHMKKVEKDETHKIKIDGRARAHFASLMST